MKLPTKVRMVSPSGLMVLDPSLVLVWDSKTGSFTLMEMAATREETDVPGLIVFLKKSLRVLTMASRKAVWWVPPCVVCCPLTKE